MTPFKALTKEQQKRQVKQILVRLAEAYGVTKPQLPKVLGSNKSVINNWVYYARIPFEHLQHCSEITGVSIDWLVTGNPPSPMSAEQKKALIETIKNCQMQILKDGCDYGLINRQQPDALTLLNNKFAKDLSEQFEVTQDTIATQLTTQ